MKKETFTNRDLFEMDFARGERIAFLGSLQSRNPLVRFLVKYLMDFKKQWSKVFLF